MVIIIYNNCCRLDDFENSCAAYDKALELSDDYLTYLNYSITLYTNDEQVRSCICMMLFYFIWFPCLPYISVELLMNLIMLGASA